MSGRPPVRNDQPDNHNDGAVHVHLGVEAVGDQTGRVRFLPDENLVPGHEITDGNGQQGAYNNQGYLREFSFSSSDDFRKNFIADEEYEKSDNKGHRIFDPADPF